MPSFRTPALLALVLVVGLIAGCGGSDSSSSSSTSGATGATGDTGASTTSADSGDYAGQVDTEALAAFNKNYTSLGSKAANPSSASDYLNTVKDLQGEVNSVVSNLNDIQPPADAESFHNDLIAAFESLGKGLDPVIKATEDKDKEALISAAGAFATSSTDFAQESIKLGQEAQKQGYSIPSLAGG